MTQAVRNPLYRRHRFPADVIANAIWLYFRFPLSLRMVEDLLAARGVVVSHQTLRIWAEKFGRHFANEIRLRSAGMLGDKWHLDEVVISIGGKTRWLWGLSIRMASFSTCWCRGAAIPKPPDA